MSVKTLLQEIYIIWGPQFYLFILILLNVGCINVPFVYFYEKPWINMKAKESYLPGNT